MYLALVLPFQPHARLTCSQPSKHQDSLQSLQLAGCLVPEQQGQEGENLW